MVLLDTVLYAAVRRLINNLKRRTYIRVHVQPKPKRGLSQNLISLVAPEK